MQSLMFLILSLHLASTAPIITQLNSISRMQELKELFLNFRHCQFHILRSSAPTIDPALEVLSYTHAISNQLSPYLFSNPYPEPCDWWLKGPLSVTSQRHALCRVLVFGPEFTTSLSELPRTFRCLPRVMFLVKSQFSLIITSEPIATNYNEEMRVLLNTIRRASVPSIFLLYSPIKNDGPRILQMLIATSSTDNSFDNWPMLQRVQKVDPKEILAQYQETHRNLHGSRVRAVVGDNLLNPDCIESMQSNVLQMQVRMCLVQEIRDKLNFSVEPQGGGIPWSPEAEFVSTIVMNNFNQDHLRESVNNASLMNYHWISSCSEYLRFGYLQVFDTTLLTREAIWGGVGWRMYALYLVAMLAVTVALFALLHARVGCSCRAFLDILAAAGTAFVDQCEISRRIKTALNFRAICVLSLWAHVSSQITNTYKGSLYSSLSSPVVGAQPENLQEITEFPGHLISTAKFWDNGGWRSTIHTSVGDLLRKFGRGSKLSDLLDEFHKKLIFDNATVDEAILSQLSSMRKHNGEEASILGRASEYILFETTTVLRAFKIFMDLTAVSENKVIKSGKEVPLFREVGPLLAQGNFISPNVARVADGIGECGIWSMWQRYYDRWFAIKHYGMIAERLHRNDMTNELPKKLRTNIAAVLFDGNSFHLFERTFKRERPPSSLKALLKIFEFYIISAAVACAALCCEVFWARFASLCRKICGGAWGRIMSDRFMDLYSGSRKVSWLSMSSQVTIIENNCI